MSRLTSAAAGIMIKRPGCQQRRTGNKFRVQEPHDGCRGSTAGAGSSQTSRDLSKLRFYVGTSFLIPKQSKSSVGDVFNCGGLLNEFREDFLIRKQVRHREVFHAY